MKNTLNKFIGRPHAIAVQLSHVVAIALIAGTFGVSAISQAAYLPLGEVLKYYSYTPPSTQELDIQKMVRIGSELQRSLTIDTSKYIPTNMSATNDDADVAGKILSHTVQTMIDDDNSGFMLIHEAHKLNESLTTDFAFDHSSSDDDAPSTPTVKTSHDIGKFKLRLRPTATEAQIRYEGRFGANLSYNIGEATTKLQFSWSF